MFYPIETKVGGATPLFLKNNNSNKGEGSKTFCPQVFQEKVPVLQFDTQLRSISKTKASSSRDRVSPGTGGGAGPACLPDESKVTLPESSHSPAFPLCQSCLTFSEGPQVQLDREAQTGFVWGFGRGRVAEGKRL